ncbi:MAG: efflux RND transporter permease subunit [Chthoniobacteraceae bacterium]
MNFTLWAQRHSRSIVFLLVLLAVAGAISSLQLPVGLFPQVSFPTVRISLDAGDRPAERMSVEVTSPVEESVRAIPGVRNVRSTTSRGSAEVQVSFDWSDDMVSALLQVQSDVNKILPTLPAGTTFDVERLDPTVFPVICYSLTSDKLPLATLRDLTLYTLRPALLTVNGVARIEAQGGDTKEYQIIVDPAKLQAHDLALSDVATALSASNVLTAVGKQEQYDKLYLIISDTRLQKFAEIKNTVLRSTPGAVVLLRDVASVVDAVEPRWTRVTADGHDAVNFLVYQQPGGNTVEIAQGIKDKLQEISKQIPAGVKIANWYDQSGLIVASAATTRDAVIIGIILAALVLLVFLRNGKATLIAVLTVPTALSATMLLLSVLGMSLNIMTLGGMAAAVGLIIDDAIVMVEHIMRRVRGEDEGSSRARVLRAAGEFTFPLAGSSMATIIIFAPLAFLSGVAGAFFKALSLTMAASLLISFVIAWLAVPVLSAKLLSEKDAEGEERGPIMLRFHAGYRWLMTRLMASPRWVLLFILPLLLVGWLAYSQVASGFMPTMDEGSFILDYVSPPGTSLTETDRLLKQVEGILQATPEVDTYSRRTGLQLGGSITEPNVGDFLIKLKPFPRRSIEEVMDDVRSRVEGNVPGLEIETAQLMEDLIGDLTSVPEPIEIKLFSDDEATLAQVAPKVAEAIGKVNGVVEVKDGIVPAGDALNIEVDRVKAALEGMDPDAITKFLSDALEGNVATSIQEGPKLINLRVVLPPSVRKTQRDLGNLLIRAPDGHLFPLKRVATLQSVIGQPEINRDDLKRMVAVTGRISGRDLGSTVAEIKKLLDGGTLLPPRCRPPWAASTSSSRSLSAASPSCCWRRQRWCSCSCFSSTKAFA